MNVTQAQAVVPRLIWRESSPSTNDDLLAAVRNDAALPEFTTVATDNQTGGRGRMGRAWVAPAGRCLAVSVLVRPFDGPTGDAGRAWIPLLAGVAVARAAHAELTRAGLDQPVSVKWPNDVRIAGGKVAGILCEVDPGTGAIVIGTGINISLTAEELPVDTASSLLLAGARDVDAGQVLANYLRELTTLVREFHAAGDDAERSGLRTAVLSFMDTIGARVRVELPDGSTLIGAATGLASDGRLIVDDGRVLTEVGAADITHLRY